MADVQIPYADPGRASVEQLDTHTQGFLLAGNHPPLAPAYGFPLPNSSSYEQFSVVGLNDAGKLVLATTGAVDPEDNVQAIGVLAHASSLGATGAGNGPVFYSGCFNQDALVWDDSFDTDAKKQAAFRGAPTPTTIIVAKRAV